MDPRPDLEEDAALWGQLLTKAKEEDPELYGILHGFRCGGAKLKVENGGLIMEPRFDENHDKAIWADKSEYKSDREEFLLPKAEEIKGLFKEMNEKQLEVKA